jgi:hypothetical protein
VDSLSLEVFPNPYSPLFTTPSQRLTFLAIPSTFYIPGSLLCAGNTMANEADMNPVSCNNQSRGLFIIFYPAPPYKNIKENLKKPDF